MTNIQSESSGFIAQALYRLKYRNGRTWRSRVDIFVEALSVVTTLRLHERQGVTVQWDDYADLHLWRLGPNRFAAIIAAYLLITFGWGAWHARSAGKSSGRCRPPRR